MIDEKKLIEDFKNTFSDSVLNQTFGFGKYTFLEAIEEMINRQPQIVTDTNVGSKWIPCKERLPSEDEYVLCQGIHSQFIACIDSLDGKWRDSHYITRSKVIAWQPLPAPYKKGGAEDEL